MISTIISAYNYLYNIPFERAKFFLHAELIFIASFFLEAIDPGSVLDYTDNRLGELDKMAYFISYVI